MTYDRRTIMTKAWAIVRRFEGNGETLHQRLSRALKSAWGDAKDAARVAATVAQRAAEKAERLARLTDEALRQIVATTCNAAHLTLADLDDLHDHEAELGRRAGGASTAALAA